MVNTHINLYSCCWLINFLKLIVSVLIFRVIILIDCTVQGYNPTCWVFIFDRFITWCSVINIKQTQIITFFHCAALLWVSPKVSFYYIEGPHFVEWQVSHLEGNRYSYIDSSVNPIYKIWQLWCVHKYRRHIFTVDYGFRLHSYFVVPSGQSVLSDPEHLVQRARLLQRGVWGAKDHGAGPGFPLNGWRWSYDVTGHLPPGHLEDGRPHRSAHTAGQCICSLFHSGIIVKVS